MGRVPGHKSITGNEMADIEVETAHDNVLIHPTERYLPQDVTKWLTTKAIESRNLKWNEMKERKSNPEYQRRTKDTEGLGKKNQTIITWIKTRYTGATHSYIIEKRDNTDCPFCNTKLTVKHIQWKCKETEQDRITMNITKEV
jgi:hypothetical protein